MSGAGMRDDAGARARMRISRFLMAGCAGTRPAAQGSRTLLESPDRGTISVPTDALATMMREGLVQRRGGQVGLSPEGRAKLRRAQADEQPFETQHREIGAKTIAMGDVRRTVRANLSESPLAHLARRRTKNGRPFLAAEEVDAGERLRSDYTRGRLMPRMGANWQASVSSGRRDGGIAELTDAALASRQRVEHALDAVGPELSGLLVDICCFLKGLEEVERERGWPVRSAKVVLKTALAMLSRHYRPPARGTAGTGRSRVRHWGAEGYRPEISGGSGQ